MQDTPEKPCQKSHKKRVTNSLLPSLFKLRVSQQIVVITLHQEPPVCNVTHGLANFCTTKAASVFAHCTALSDEAFKECSNLAIATSRSCADTLCHFSFSLCSCLLGSLASYVSVLLLDAIVHVSPCDHHASLKHC